MYQKIMVPLDGSDLAECVFLHLKILASTGNVKEAVIVRVIEPLFQPSISEYSLKPEEVVRVKAEMEKEAETYLNGVLQKINLGAASVRGEILHGRAAETLADYASRNGIDLIVMATHGRSGVSRWVWGGVADRILRSACVPVLMVRAPGCVPGI
jgi:nucleotide-binding universal stress UspA family protein